MIMISVEPRIKVGICAGYERVAVRLNGPFLLDGRSVRGFLELQPEKGGISGRNEKGRELFCGRQVVLQAEPGSTFSIDDVTIGVNFHWERRRQETFRGNLLLIASPEKQMSVINEIGLEEYLESVIASEMSGTAPLEFLKAHAVISRSWLAAMLERKTGDFAPGPRVPPPAGEIMRWYGREDHAGFDVCADDHCQRYQGIPEKQGRAAEAVQATHGVFLVHDGRVCDARYHKACGGRTEDFATAWEDLEVPYLTSITDAAAPCPPPGSAAGMNHWLLSLPDAYCATTDEDVLKEVLPSFDQETGNFYRWRIEYRREELEELIGEKTGCDVGALLDLVPLARGPSGRISRLRILGRKTSLIVGKELEIRRLLSRSHLLSSAFTLFVERGLSGLPARFIFHGAGWGHGVGLCQIGAAVMATRGFPAPEILQHYFRGAALQKLY